MKTSQKILFIAIGLAAFTLAVYWQVHTFEFITFDDNLYVYENDQVRKGLTIDNLSWAFAFTRQNTDTPIYWHPLTWLSHMTDVELFGSTPGSHHLMNLFFHVANVLLLFIAMHLMTGEIWKSAFVAALFALHPINVDSVAWIAERKNLLSTFFWMLTMLAYIYYARKPGLLRYFLVFFNLALGLLAKPMLVTLPCALLLLDFWPLGRMNFGHILPPHAIQAAPLPSGIPRLILEKLPMLCLCLASIILSTNSIPLIQAETVPMTLRIGNALVSYPQYLWKLIMPINLAFFYPFPISIPLWQSLSALFFLLIISALSLGRFRKSPYLPVGWFWFMGTLVPVIGLVQGGLWPALADRWAYVPSIGIFMITAWGIPEALTGLRFPRKMLAVLAAITLCILSTFTYRQAGYWKTSQSLYEHAIAATSGNYTAHNNLGVVFQRMDRMDDALAEYQKALKVYADYPLAHFNLAGLLNKLGKKREALSHLDHALHITPYYWQAHEKMAEILLDLKETDAAANHYSEAIRIAPFNPKLHFNLATLFLSIGRSDAAIFHFQQALKNFPEMVEARISLGNAYFGQEKLNEAIQEYQKALEISYKNAEAHVNLANAWMRKGNTDKAIHHYVKAIGINPEIPETHNNLGIAYISKGDMPSAIGCFRKALSLRPGYESAINNLHRVEQMTAP